MVESLAASAARRKSPVQTPAVAEGWRQWAGWPALAVGLPLAWLVLAPLLVLAISAFKPTGFLLDPGFTLDILIDTWTSAEVWRLVQRTLAFAAGSTVLALILGGILAFIVERTDLRGRDFVRPFILVPMAIPPFLTAIGWTLLLSPRTGTINIALMQLFGLTKAPFDIYSLSGMIFIEGLALSPSAFLVLSPALRNFDAALEEAALMSGAGSWSLVRRVVLPLLTPALAGASAYLMIVSCMVFDVPGTIGMPGGVSVLSTYLYDLLNNSPTGLPDYAAMSAIALLVIVALSLVCLLYQRLMREASRYVTVGARAFRPRPFHLGALAPAAGIFVTLYALVTVVLPLGMLVWSSLMPYLMPFSLDALHQLTLANHRDIFAEPGMGLALWHSLEIAFVVACVVALFACLISVVVVRSRAPGRGLIDLLAFLPLAMPGVLIGTALVYVYLLVRVVPIYGSVWIITVAHVTVYLSFGSRTTNAALTQLHPELEEAARMCGASRFTGLRRVLVPLAAPALGAVWIWVFSHSLRELSAALMLQGAANKTVPTMLFGYWSQGLATRAAAVGVWLAAGLLALLLLSALLQALQRWRAD